MTSGNTDNSGGLLDAIWSQDLSAISQLLDQGADARFVARDGSNLLHKAAAVGNCAIVQLLAERGADVAADDDQGRTPVCIALDHGFTAMADILFRFGATSEAWAKRTFGQAASKI